jgi:L-ascorbate metabolism protein UlaG (beta-lactamase superfamily)
MEFQYFGANCVRLTTKKATIVIDDNLKEIGSHAITKHDDIALSTTGALNVEKARYIIDSAGEYEISGVSVMGISARSHMDEAGKKSATIFKLIADDIRIGVLGHIYPDLSDEQLEALGTVDVLLVPVGGNGYTLDPIGALKLIKKIEPRIIIPTHYAQDGLQYPVPQQDVAEALKALAMEPQRIEGKYKLKAADIPELAQLVLLEASK